MSDRRPSIPAYVPAATVHEAYGRRGAFDSSLTAIRIDQAVVSGRALPVRCAPGDNLALHRALAIASPGDVLVVDGAGVSVGYMGDVMATAALARGVSAAIIDGGVRDTAEIAELGLPVWSRSVAIRGAGKAAPGSVGEAIVCGGTVVAPGSWIVADADGIVAVDPRDIVTTLEAARRREAEEEALKHELRAGAVTLDLLGLRELADA